MSGPSLPPVGMQMPDAQKTAIQDKAKKMLQTVLGTEVLVDKILEML